VYDMYPWNQPAYSREETADPGPAGQAARALQVALDRRDNGGHSGAAPDQ
jgi:hypothetical protein